MSIFLQLSDITGDVTEKNHQGWIELSSVDFGIDRPVKQCVGRMSDRESRLPLFQDLSMTKPIDKSSLALFDSACTGKVIAEATIDFCHTSEPLSTFAKYRLNDVIISEYKDSTLGDTMPLERIKLSYTKIEKTHIPHDNKHQPTSQNSTGFDLIKATKL